MQVIIKGGFTYTAEFLIKEEAYAKLLSAAETFGKDNASAMLGLYLESQVHNLKDVDKYAMMMLKDSITSQHVRENVKRWSTLCMKGMKMSKNSWRVLLDGELASSSS